MKQRIAYLTAALLIMLSAIACHAEKHSDVAILTYVEGDVQLKLNDESEWGSAELDIALQKDDSIRTGQDGKVRIVLEDESVIVLGAFSVFRISAIDKDYSTGRINAEFSLDSGELRAKVTKLQTSDSVFNVTTPTAVAGVRGTEFAVEIPPGADVTTVTVFDGVVEVGNRLDKLSKAVRVLKEHATDVRGGDAPTKPTKIDASKLSNLKQRLSHRKQKRGDGTVALDDKKAATIVAIKRSDLSKEDASELVNSVKDGKVPTGQVKDVLSIAASGASAKDVAKVIEIIKRKDIDPKDVKEFVDNVRKKGDDADIAGEIGEFEKKARKRPDRPGAAGDAAVAPTTKIRPVAGEKTGPISGGPDVERVTDKAKDVREDVTNNDNRNNAGPNSTSGPSRREQLLIDGAIKAKIPKDKIEALIRAFKDGRLDFADARMIIDAVGNGVNIDYVTRVTKDLYASKTNITTRRLLLNAIRLGLPSDVAMKIMKGLNHPSVDNIKKLNEELQKYIRSKLKPPVGPDVTNSTSGNATPPPASAVPSNASAD